MNSSKTSSNSQPQEIIIEAGRSERQYWRDVWNYRELFLFLAWRDILVRYKQTVVGVIWALLRPLLAMVVLTIVFGKWANLPSEGIPYPILVFAAMLPWQFFANSFTGASNSLIANTNLISKVYFPRLIIPTSSLVVCFADFLISGVIFFGLMVWYDFWPTLRICALPVFILIVIAVTLGTGLWISALNVKYRDFRYIVPFIVQFGLYISPVGFSTNVVPDEWRLLYSLNPMVGVIDGFRWAMLKTQIDFYLTGFVISICITILLLIGGLWFFRKTEKTFADVI